MSADQQKINAAIAALTELRSKLMANPPEHSSKERVISHYAGLVGDAMVGIDNVIFTLTA